MTNFFGDTDDITFGGHVGHNPSSKPQPSRAQPPRERSPLSTPRRDDVRPPQRRQNHEEFVPPAPQPLSANLKMLISSMKPTYFPPMESGGVRITSLSPSNHHDPLLLIRSGDTTLILGTGFSETLHAGKSYQTFPDLRLIESEKDRLSGWILLTPGFDTSLFRLLIETLSFPYVYGTRDVIAYIRDTIKDAAFLEKCRFFELITPELAMRKIGDISLSESGGALIVTADSVKLSYDLTGSSLAQGYSLTRDEKGFLFAGKAFLFEDGEIIDILPSGLERQQLRFTFDTFYIDKGSVGVLAGYALKDRQELSENGVLTFVLEEDPRARAIVGHIFIDSRGFVHAHEMMSVHKQILRGIRHIYESSIIKNPRIERGELVATLRRELTKFCYLITGRTPVVMPIIIER